MADRTSDPAGIRCFDPVDDCWFLTGPTASGKTAVGLALAKRLDAEIISLDSMAIYTGMDVGTAKPTVDERRQVPHHLIDLVAPTEEFSLSQYVEAAHAVVAAIRSRGRAILFVGGTPLYLKALLRGLYPGPPADWEFRREIERELESVDEDALYERLRQVDPLVASRLHPHDRRRIIRALEVYRLTGRPLGHRQTQFDEARPEHRCRVVALAWPRELLHSRIEARVESMFRAGLVDEVRTLRALHGELGRTASQAVGYREVIEYLRGVRGWGETIEAVKVRTRRFARRQETWFRSLVECRRQLQDRDCWPEATADAIVQQEW